MLLASPTQRPNHSGAFGFTNAIELEEDRPTRRWRISAHRHSRWTTARGSGSHRTGPSTRRRPRARLAMRRRGRPVDQQSHRRDASEDRRLDDKAALSDRTGPRSGSRRWWPLWFSVSLAPRNAGLEPENAQGPENGHAGGPTTTVSAVGRDVLSVLLANEEWTMARPLRRRQIFRWSEAPVARSLQRWPHAPHVSNPPQLE